MNNQRGGGRILVPVGKCPPPPPPQKKHLPMATTSGPGGHREVITFSGIKVNHREMVKWSYCRISGQAGLVVL